MQGAAAPELQKLWQSSDARQRARALHLLARIDSNGQSYVTPALKDSDSDIRITGLRIARELKMDVVSLAKPLVKDSSAQVRREVAIALRHNESPDAPKLWAQLFTTHWPVKSIRCS